MTRAAARWLRAALLFVPVLGWALLWLFEPYFWRMASAEPGESYASAFRRWPSEAKMHISIPSPKHPLYRWARRFPREPR